MAYDRNRKSVKKILDTLDFLDTAKKEALEAKEKSRKILRAYYDLKKEIVLKPIDMSLEEFYMIVDKAEFNAEKTNQIKCDMQNYMLKYNRKIEEERIKARTLVNGYYDKKAKEIVRPLIDMSLEEFNEYVDKTDWEAKKIQRVKTLMKNYMHNYNFKLAKEKLEAKQIVYDYYDKEKKIIRKHLVGITLENFNEFVDKLDVEETEKILIKSLMNQYMNEYNRRLERDKFQAIDIVLEYYDIKTDIIKKPLTDMTLDKFYSFVNKTNWPDQRKNKVKKLMFNYMENYNRTLKEIEEAKQIVSEYYNAETDEILKPLIDITLQAFNRLIDKIDWKLKRKNKVKTLMQKYMNEYNRKLETEQINAKKIVLKYYTYARKTIKIPLTDMTIEEFNEYVDKTDWDEIKKTEIKILMQQYMENYNCELEQKLREVRLIVFSYYDSETGKIIKPLTSITLAEFNDYVDKTDLEFEEKNQIKHLMKERMKLKRHELIETKMNELFFSNLKFGGGKYLDKSYLPLKNKTCYFLDQDREDPYRIVTDRQRELLNNLDNPIVYFSKTLIGLEKNPDETDYIFPDELFMDLQVYYTFASNPIQILTVAVLLVHINKLGYALMVCEELLLHVKELDILIKVRALISKIEEVRKSPVENS